MKEDNVLQVYYGEKLVGTLALTADYKAAFQYAQEWLCLLYTSPSPRDRTRSRMPSSA